MSDDVNGPRTVGGGDDWDGVERRTSRQDTLQAARDLQGSMEELASEITSLKNYGRHNRQLITVLAVFALVIAGLVVWNSILSSQASDASKKAAEATSLAAQNKQNQKAVCLAGNESRGVQIQLWTFVVNASIASNPNATPAQRKFFDEFRQYIDTVFAPRDCDKPAPVVKYPLPPSLPPMTRPTPTVTPTR